VARGRIPLPLLIFFCIDVALGMAYMFNYLAGHPVRALTHFLDLNREGNLPTWYASIKWCCVAVLLGIFTHRNFSPSQRKSWLLLTLPLVFLALSLDEIAQIHEGLGRKSEILLPGISRKNALFSQTGMWMFIIGVPFLALFVVLILSIRTYFQRAPGALVKMCLGMAISLAGAIGVEILTNFVVPNSVYDVLQVFSEELCEMLGSTIVLWGSYELLDKHGVALRLDSAEINQSAPPYSNSG
jgi:hypothetical protein